MIDIKLFRLMQEIATNGLDSCGQHRKYFLDIFTDYGFTTSVDNIQQLRKFVDVFHDNRFDPYMKEIYGFSEKELNSFLKICLKIIKFQLKYFPNSDPIVPFNSLMASLVVYNKICVLKQGFKNILEIGPGNGYLSFFLGDHQGLDKYVQIETCESLYIWQSYINDFVFGRGFEQKLFDLLKKDDYFLGDFEHGDDCICEKRFTIDRSKFAPTIKCLQYPWWKIGALNKSELLFDVIVSNANLLEFTPGALEDYLSLIGNKLDFNGIFFAHCFGLGEFGRDYEYLFKKLYNFGFAPLFIAADGNPVLMPETDSKKVIVAPAGAAGRRFVKSSNFLQRHKEVFFLDNYRKEKEIGGVRVISKKDIEGGAVGKIDEAFIIHHDKEIVKDFSDFFENMSITYYGNRVYPVSNGVFINKKHQLFNRFYDYNNFSRCFNADIDLIRPFCRTRENPEYTKEEIMRMLEESIAS